MLLRGTGLDSEQIARDASGTLRWLEQRGEGRPLLSTMVGDTGLEPVTSAVLCNGFSMILSFGAVYCIGVEPL